MLWFSDNMLILLITIDVDTCGSCPDSSYDDGLDSCRECHPSCVTCDGPNSDDCIISASVTQTSTVLRTSSTSTSTSFSPSESKSTASSPSISITPKESLIILPPVDILPPLVISPSPSSTFIPTSARDCSEKEECDPETLAIVLGENSSITNLVLSDSSGNTVGVVIIPNSVSPGGVLSVTVLSGIDSNDFDNVLGNSFIDITLVDIFSNSVTQLVDPIEICVAKNRDVDVSLLRVNTFLNPGCILFRIFQCRYQSMGM
mmetsp:Transcript_5546/g.6827  ORF Transcript_5546/g.6827 Transcript_5546/m.6827 type:complete len:260 (+) Transcript_5546:16-795(+)